MSGKYEIVPDGGRFILRRKDKLACCDCGLVHRTETRVVKGVIYMRIFRDERATAAKRRAARHRRTVGELARKMVKA